MGHLSSEGGRCPEKLHGVSQGSREGAARAQDGPEQGMTRSLHLH